MNNDSGHNTGLFRVMIVGTALSFGVLAAIIVSMKDFVGGDATFHFSYRTVVAFLMGAVVGWLFWKVILHFARKGGGPA